MTAKLKNQVVGAFKMHGFTLRSDASKYLVEVLLPINDEQREEALDKLLEAIQKQPLKTSMINRDVCEAAIRECNQEDEEDSDKILSVIDAFTIPRYSYVHERKKFIPNATLNLPTPTLLGGADVKANLFRERYTILHQRTSRHDLFTPAVLRIQSDSKKFQLKPVEFLLGSTAKLGDIIVLGMLAQLKESKWFLEDPTGAVQLNLSRANFHTGLFTENCFVLAEGWYEDDIFHVNAFGFPPPESSSTTRNYFGNVNFFGGPSPVCVKASSKLKQIEEENEDAMIVIISDVWLDHVKVMDKLKVLFAGYSQMPPTCFVFCGNFTSTPYGPNHIKTLKESLRSFADLLSNYPALLENSRFVFVPGPQDPGYANILPRPPIPKTITEDFRRQVPGVEFATNPCRIQYCTREIVVFREDIVMKMCRNCVRYPSDGHIPSHFAKTVICQAHLCPLPLHVEPIYWAHDNALQVYPLPDVIICADKYDPYTETQVDCIVANPGSFPRSNFAFKVYYPATGQIEESRISDD